MLRSGEHSDVLREERAGRTCELALPGREGTLARRVVGRFLLGHLGSATEPAAATQTATRRQCVWRNCRSRSRSSRHNCRATRDARSSCLTTIAALASAFCGAGLSCGFHCMVQGVRRHGSSHARRSGKPPQKQARQCALSGPWTRSPRSVQIPSRCCWRRRCLTSGHADGPQPLGCQANAGRRRSVWDWPLRRLGALPRAHATSVARDTWRQRRQARLCCQCVRGGRCAVRSPRRAALLVRRRRPPCRARRTGT